MPAIELPIRLQALPPRAAHFCLGVERFLRRELAADLDGAVVVAGFSGGPDSTALLLCLECLAPRLGFSLQAAHLDHGLRPESRAEADRAERFCSGLGIPFASCAADTATLARERGVGIEEAGRELRYAFFAECLAGHSKAFLALGHTLDDLAEDQLMRLIRGAGWPGLGGMPAFDPGRHLLRPLLLTPKSDVLDFLADLGAEYASDASNADQAFLRNRVRSGILPLLRAENPAYLDAAAGLWRLAQLDREVLDSRCAAPEPGPDGRIALPRSALAALPRALRLRLFKSCLERLGPGQPLLDGLLRLDEVLLAGASGKAVQFPGRKTARLQRDALVFSGPE
ncbi:MAG: tRNA lysidine(34) synthetase TilS [Thermodesulfobacteriota bacterium]